MLSLGKTAPAKPPVDIDQIRAELDHLKKVREVERKYGNHLTDSQLAACLKQEEEEEILRQKRAESDIKAKEQEELEQVLLEKSLRDLCDAAYLIIHVNKRRVKATPDGVPCPHCGKPVTATKAPLMILAQRTRYNPDPYELLPLFAFFHGSYTCSNCRKDMPAIFQIVPE